MTNKNHEYRIQLATRNDLPVIMKMIEDGKERLKNMRVDQWQNGYPNEEVILKDMKVGNSYLFFAGDTPVATFALIFDNDPTYSSIKEGEWLTMNPYTVIHRIAVSENHLGKGIMGQLLQKVGEKSLAKGFGSMRMDTHPENKTMQRALLKNKFEFCGHIYLENNNLRFAYERIWNEKW